MCHKVSRLKMKICINLWDCAWFEQIGNQKKGQAQAFHDIQTISWLKMNWNCMNLYHKVKYLQKAMINFWGCNWIHLWMRGLLDSGVIHILCQIFNQIKIQSFIKFEWCSHTCSNCSGFDLCKAFYFKYSIILAACPLQKL